jgi:para-aminobenzoate synthetase/4-amino-4-deoxychorismate lyase
LAAFRFDTLKTPYVLLDDRLAGGAGGRLYAEPRAVIRCADIDDVDAAFEEIEQGLAGGLHAAGLFAYELGYALEPRLARLIPERRDTPLLWLGLFEPPQMIAAEALDAAFSGLGPPSPMTRLCGDHDRARHVAKVDQILRLIEAGDVYQVNLTFPLRFHYAGDPLSLYAALRSRQPVAHGGVAALGDMTVLSVSPELFVQVCDGQATTRPMKGTCARGADPAADKHARAALAADPKQRAENVMIVDLLRNDLARISAPGTVQAPDLFTMETYPSFHALTSTITSRLKGGQTLRERIAALFPCGSIVGAPKIRAAEIIRSLEPSARGFYTGALGAISPGGDMAFNVAIRTAIIKPDGTGRYGVGGGIVADSNPDDEYDEAWLKARVLTDLAEDYGLIETFRWSASAGFVRLSLHLARMAESARRLGFAFDQPEAEAALNRLALSWGPSRADQRVRLQLARTGALDLTHAVLMASKAVLTVGLADVRLDTSDPFLMHKTTRRGAFERAFEAAAKQGLDEVVFTNQHGEVAEASRNTVFIEVDGKLITPPLSSGVLPGVLRRHLLESGKAVERTLPLGLVRSQPMLLGNSLHGLRPALFESVEVREVVGAA